MPDLDEINGATVYDSSGDKLGTVADTYIDRGTRAASWIIVRSGFLGTRETTVPVAATQFDGTNVHVAFSKKVLEAAPHVEAHGDLEPTQEAELLHYYADAARALGIGTRERPRTTQEQHLQSPLPDAEVHDQPYLTGPGATVPPEPGSTPVPDVPPPPAEPQPAWPEPDPRQPPTPGVPEVPGVPGGPAVPGVPGVPGGPAVPGGPGIPPRPASPTDTGRTSTPTFPN
jgi:sporulation protein YlmC with PRC-barrel domain